MAKIVSGFLSLILSFTLMVSPVSTYAQDASGSGADQYRENSLGDSDWDFYLAQSVSLINGVIGSSVLSSCTMGLHLPSIIVYLAAGGSSVLFEMITGLIYQNFHYQKINDLAISKAKAEERIKTNSMVESEDVQRQSLETARDDEIKFRDIVLARSIASTVIATAYWAAMILSIVEVIEEGVSFGAYSSAAECSTKGGHAVIAKVIPMAWGLGSSFSATGQGEGASGFGTATSIATAAMGVLTALVPSVSEAITKSMTNGISRSIIFGVLAGTQTAVTVGMYQRYDKLKTNVDILNDLISRLDQLRAGNEGLTGSSSTSGNVGTVAALPAPIPGPVGLLPPPNNQNVCINQGSSGVNFSTGNCRSNITFQKPNFEAMSNMPTLASVVTNLTDMSNNLSSGQYQKAYANAMSIHSNAAKIRTLRDQVIKQAKEVYAKEGKKFPDLDAEIKKVSSKIKADYQKAAQKAGFNPNQMAKAMPKTESVAKENVEVLKVKEKMGKDAEVKHAFSELEEESFDEEINLAQKEVAILDATHYKIQTDDVIKDKETPLFQVISNRYLINHPRFFQEKKSDKAPPSKPAN